MGSRPSRASQQSNKDARQEENVIGQTESKTKTPEQEDKLNKGDREEIEKLQKENSVLRETNTKLTTEIHELKQSIELGSRAASPISAHDRKSLNGSIYETSDETEPDQRSRRSRKQRNTKNKFVQPMSDIDAYGQGLPIHHSMEKLTLGRSRKHSRKVDSSKHHESLVHKDSVKTIQSLVDETPEHQEPNVDEKGNMNKDPKEGAKKESTTDESDTNKVPGNEDKSTDEQTITMVTSLTLSPSKEKTMSMDSGIGETGKERETNGNKDLPVPDEDILEDHLVYESQKRFIDLK